MDRAHLEQLLDCYLDESLTPGQRLELEAALLSSAEARATFWEHARLHSALREWGERQWGARRAEQPPARGKILAFFTAPPVRMALAAGLAILLLAGWLLRSPSSSKARPEQTTAAIAVLTQVAEAQWSPDGGARAVGASLGPGWLRLQSGLAQVEFISGARVLLQGPAELQLISPMESFCRSGRCTVEVPPQAQGFTVRSPGVSVTDLGTSFGLEVRPGGSAQVQVLRGEVELHGLAKTSRNLTEGQAVQVAADGHIEPLSGQRTEFLTAESLALRLVDGWQERRERWLASTQRFAGDPALAIHYLFEDSTPWSRTLENTVAGSSKGTAGSIVGCRWGEGRWPGKRALEFRGVSDRVRFTLPGDFSALTMAAWVRVDSLDLDLNGLVMADGFDPGKVHWQLRRNGTVRLGVRHTSDAAHEDHDTPAGALSDRFGQWVQLAVTLDGESRRLVHYLNGRPLASATYADTAPLRLGPAELGNWSPGAVAGNRPIRNLRGGMDEFFLFTRALSGDEIGALYEAGRPRL